MDFDFYTDRIYSTYMTVALTNPRIIDTVPTEHVCYLQGLQWMRDIENTAIPPATSVIMWNLILYIVAVVVGLVLYYTYENEENEECTNQQQAGSSSESAVKPGATDFRLSSLFAVLGFPVPGNTSEERFESFTEHFSTFDEVVIVVLM